MISPLAASMPDYRIERIARRRYLRKAFTLARSVVYGTADRESRNKAADALLGIVFRIEPFLLCRKLLKLRLIISFGSHLAEKRLVEELARCIEPAVEIYGAEHRLVKIGNRLDIEFGPIDACADAQKLEKPVLANEPSERLTRNDARAPRGQLALSCVGRTAEQLDPDEKIQNTVAQKFETLVGDDIIMSTDAAADTSLVDP